MLLLFEYAKDLKLGGHAGQEDNLHRAWQWRRVHSRLRQAGGRHRLSGLLPTCLHSVVLQPRQQDLA